MSRYLNDKDIEKSVQARNHLALYLMLSNKSLKEVCDKLMLDEYYLEKFLYKYIDINDKLAVKILEELKLESNVYTTDEMLTDEDIEDFINWRENRIVN